MIFCNKTLKSYYPVAVLSGKSLDVGNVTNGDVHFFWMDKVTYVPHVCVIV